MNNNFCIKGKKSGIVGSAISNFWSYVLFVFVVIIFFVIFSIQEREVRENVIGSSESETNIDITSQYTEKRTKCPKKIDHKT